MVKQDQNTGALYVSRTPVLTKVKQPLQLTQNRGLGVSVDQELDVLAAVKVGLTPGIAKQLPQHHSYLVFGLVRELVELLLYALFLVFDDVPNDSHAQSCGGGHEVFVQTLFHSGGVGFDVAGHRGGAHLDVDDAGVLTTLHQILQAQEVVHLLLSNLSRTRLNLFDVNEFGNEAS